MCSKCFLTKPVNISSHSDRAEVVCQSLFACLLACEHLDMEEAHGAFGTLEASLLQFLVTETKRKLTRETNELCKRE